MSTPTPGANDPNNNFFAAIRCLQGTKPQRKACRAACTKETCPLILSYWNYLPSVPLNVAFGVIFGLYLIIIMVTGVRARRFKKYTAMIVIGQSMEVLGFIARTYAFYTPFSDIAFITQLTTLTLAPAFMAAGIYFSLQKIVLTFGANNSRLPPALIPKIFITCDVISLILQGLGGAMAAYYAQNEQIPDNGNFIMIAGLTFQALTLTVFLYLAIDFAVSTKRAVKRYGDSALNEDPIARSLRNSRRMRYLIISLTVSAVLILFRSIYRVAEIAEGWKGPLMGVEIYVVVFETIPILIAALLLALLHPGFVFTDEAQDLRSEPDSASRDLAGPREPLYTIRRWNEKAEKCEVEVIYDEHHPALARYRHQLHR